MIYDTPASASLRVGISLFVQHHAALDSSAFGPEVERLLSLLAAELPPKKAAALAAEISGVSKRKLYSWLVSQELPTGGPGKNDR